MRKLIALGIVLLALLAPAVAAAHPLGNFTVNQYSRIQPSGDTVYVLYVLDLAEIPTFQARSELRADGEAGVREGSCRGDRRRALAGSRWSAARTARARP